VELIWRAGLDQLSANRFQPDQPGDSTEELYMQARRFLRAHDHEEEPHRLAVDAVVGDPGSGAPADDGERPDSGAARVRDGDSEADSRTENGLPFQYGGQHLVKATARAIHQVPRELRENTLFVGSGEGNHDPVRREQLGQEHGSASRGMGTNVTVGWGGNNARIERELGLGEPGIIFGPMPATTPKSPTVPASLLDLSPTAARARLEAWVAARGLPRYRVGQLERRLWQSPVARWMDATDLPLALRSELDETLPLHRLEAEVVQQSIDGTRKYLWRLDDGEAIESVLIPSSARRTLCISSQAGCALRCAFCATGRMGFRRNLTPFEITGQIREIVLRNPADAPTNVVFMGMGEPLLNWGAVDTALTVLNDPAGFGIGARHITVSTVGILPGMEALARRPEQFRLAISLHAPTPAQRLSIMPVEKKYDLERVIRAAQAFRKRVTLEYVMIGGANDADADADRLAKIARRLGALVNILPLHPGGAPDLAPAPAERIRGFAARLRNQGIEATVRRSRGLDISAACGQLRTEVSERGLPRRSEPRRNAVDGEQ